MSSEPVAKTMDMKRLNTHRSILWLGKIKIPWKESSNIAHVEILMGIRQAVGSLFTHISKNLKQNYRNWIISLNLAKTFLYYVYINAC